MTSAPIPLFDVETLRSITEGNSDLEHSLLERFQTTLTRCVTEGIVQKPVEEWPALLRELRGAAMAIGALALAQACEEGELSPPPTAPLQERFRTDLSALTVNTLKEISSALHW